jgi:hypothetical protein
MKRRSFVFAAIAAPSLMAGCAAPIGYNPLPGGASSMLSGAQKYMGLNADQTAASLGSMFALAQNKLPAADWAKLGTTVPGIGDIVSKGAAAGGFSPTSITSLQSVVDAAGKMGVNSSQIKALAGYVTNSMSGAGGTSAANLLSSVWR